VIKLRRMKMNVILKRREM